MTTSRTLRVLLVAVVCLLAGCAPAVTPSATRSASATPAAPTVSAPVASPSAAAIVEIADVPFYRGDTLRSAIEPGPGPVAEPAVAWDVALANDATVNPILVDRAVIAGTAHEVVALDAVTGASRWTTPIDGSLEGAFS